MMDLLLNILFLIRQEVINITSASDIILTHQAFEGLTHSSPENHLISTDIISHQNDDIVNRSLDIINIANQIQEFQHTDIILLDAGVRICCLLAALNDAADRSVKKCMYGIIEVEERHKRIFITLLHLLCGFLKSGNTTLLLGVEEERVDEAIHIVESVCKSRKQITPATTTVTGLTHGEFAAFPVEVTIGGATLFVLTVDQFLKV